MVTTQQTAAQIAAATGAALNTYVVVFNSTTNQAEIWFDSDWSTTGVERVQVATINGLTASQVAALTAGDFVAYSGGIDPIILDLDGNGLSFSSLETGVAFDIDADGDKDQVAWNTSGDAMLAVDHNNNGEIDNGSELFTPFFGGGNYSSGVAALRTLDTNADRVIDASDDIFASLRVWRDADADGITDDGELVSLSEADIASINLATESTGETIDGQSVASQGTFERADGSTGAFFEMDLDVSLSEGESFLAGTESDDVLFGTDEDDVIAGLAGADTLHGFGGADRFVLSASDLANGVADYIADYSEAEGDMLDLSEVLSGLSPDLDPIADGFVSIEADGGEVQSPSTLTAPAQSMRCRKLPPSTCSMAS